MIGVKKIKIWELQRRNKTRNDDEITDKDFVISGGEACSWITVGP